jgi:hypothetical protein
MTYYAQINSKDILVGVGTAPMLADEYGSNDVQNIEVSEEVFKEQEKYIYANGKLIINPDYEQQQLELLRADKLEEADAKAREYIESGNALYAFEKEGEVYHIEATDGNIAKIGLKAMFLISINDFENKEVWNTKEDVNIYLDAIELQNIATGLGELQSQIWTVQYNNYVEQIKQAESVADLEEINIEY